MPCPFFEPRSIAAVPNYENARLPLLNEYDGACWLGREPVAVPRQLRFRYCNHGYSDEVCPGPRGAIVHSALRFHVVTANDNEVDLLCVEEKDFAPSHHFRLLYSAQSESFDPAPAPEAHCLEAQARAFCQSFLRRQKAVDENSSLQQQPAVEH